MKMNKFYTSTLLVIWLVFTALTLASCNRQTGQTQAQMFNDNKYTRKKKSKRGTYSNTKQISKKPPSVEYAEGYIADDNPKKTAKKINKQMKKAKKQAEKKRKKHNKKVHRKIKTTKGKSTKE